MTCYRINDAYTMYGVSMHLPYLLLMAPSVLYGAYARRSNKFPMRGHPGGPGGSGLDAALQTI